MGHAGTLDPLASGVLLVCLGRATRLVEYLVGLDKVYETTVRLGQSTDTYDAEGEVTAERPVTTTEADILAALANRDPAAAVVAPRRRQHERLLQVEVRVERAHVVLVLERELQPRAHAA